MFAHDIYMGKCCWFECKIKNHVKSCIICNFSVHLFQHHNSHRQSSLHFRNNDRFLFLELQRYLRLAWKQTAKEFCTITTVQAKNPSPFGQKLPKTKSHIECIRAALGISPHQACCTVSNVRCITTQWLAVEGCSLPAYPTRALWSCPL